MRMVFDMTLQNFFIVTLLNEGTEPKTTRLFSSWKELIKGVPKNMS